MNSSCLIAPARGSLFSGENAELTWNVTGHNLTLPIETAEAHITLPEATPFRQAHSYDGDAAIVEQQPGRIVFRTTRPLTPGTGLTVGASWQRGLLGPHDAIQKIRWWADDELPFVIATTGAFALLGFYLIERWYVARRPSPGNAQLQFRPPDRMSAGAMRYIASKGLGADERTLAAAMLDMEVRGHLQLEDTGAGLQIAQGSGGQPLETAETAAETALFSGGTHLLLSETNRGSLLRAKSALDDVYARAYADQLFRPNAGWAWCGAALSLALLTALRSFPRP
jgi:hypothetical protein